jgi:hypothetical protein
LIGPTPNPIAAFGAGVVSRVIGPALITAAPLHPCSSVNAGAAIGAFASVELGAPIGSSATVVSELLGLEFVEAPVSA